MQLLVEAKSVGRRKPLFTDWSVPIPPGAGGDGRTTLRALITSIVQAEVSAFRERQEARRLPQVLTRAEVEAGAARGKIEAGGREPGLPVDEAEAVATALTAFEDGLYFVFLNDEQRQELDREIVLRPNSRLLFLRLVPLVGG